MTRPTLLNDILFKIVFGSQQNEALLRALINALLGFRGEERIHSLQILNPHIDKEYLAERGVILDVKARDGRGRLYNIEVQVSHEPDYTARSLYYLARLFGEQLERGEPYSRIARTIGISLLDFNLFPDLADLHSIYRFYDVAHQRELTDILEIHYIELPKFQLDKPHRLRSSFEKWLHILKFGGLYGVGLEPVPESLKQEEGIDLAMDAMQRAYASDEVREMIEFRMKALRDEATRMEHAEQKGRAEGKAEVARKLLAQGVAPETVLEATGFTAEDLQELPDPGHSGQ